MAHMRRSVFGDGDWSITSDSSCGADNATSMQMRRSGQQFMSNETSRDRSDGIGIGDKSCLPLMEPRAAEAIFR